MAKHKIVTDKNTPVGKLTAAILELGATQGVNTVFTTFLELFATSLAAATDLINADKRRSRYEEIEKSLEPNIVAEYARLCLLTFLAVREHKSDPIDILGAVYHNLNLNNEWCGQFFTPDCVSRLMASLNNCDNEIDDGLITVCEPTCGSGTMVIAAVWSMMKRGIDYSKHSIFVCQDIDIRCVWMTYIQLTLYRIPAVIKHGNSLTLEEWDKWFTPTYFFVDGGK